MNIDRKTVLRIAELARIDLREDEVEIFGRQLGDILKYVEQLQEVTGDVEPFSFDRLLPQRMRHDQQAAENIVEDVLKNAPRKSGRFFKVPRILP